MSALSTRDQAATRDIASKLSRIPPTRLSATVAPPWLVRDLGELLRCALFMAYRPAEDRDASAGWVLGETSSTRPALVSAYDQAARKSQRPFNFHPLRPASKQRNRVCAFDEIHTHGPDETCAVEDVWPSIGMGGWDQLRVLVCKDDVLLAWVGGSRPEPFSHRERTILKALVPSLRRGLGLRRQLLDSAAHVRTVDPALAALDAPTFVAGRDGRVFHANAAAVTRLARGRGAARDRIRGALARSTFTARLEGEGLPECHLVVLRPPASEMLARLHTAASEWKVTPRELDVLRGTVVGDANKEIALKLGIHEGSVERHTTSLLRKAKCDSRSRLVAAFWTKL